MKKVQVVAAAILFAISALTVFAQTQPNLETGYKPYGSHDATGIDSINTMNGDLQVHIGLPFNYPQRGGITLPVYLHANSKGWHANLYSYPCDGSCVALGWGNPPGGIQLIPFPAMAINRVWQSDAAYSGGAMSYFHGDYYIVTLDGANHLLSGDPATADTTGEPWSFDANDASGLHLELSAPLGEGGVPGGATVTDRNGNRYQFGDWGGKCRTNANAGAEGAMPYGSAGHWNLNNYGQDIVITCNERTIAQSVTDSNGNVVNFGVADTLGRSTYSVSSTTDYSGCVGPVGGAMIYSFPASNGGSAQLKLCSNTPSLATAFNAPNIAEYPTWPGATNYDAPWPGRSWVTTAILPDGSKYTFTYDNYGEITRIGLPTGGSISYAWTTLALNPCNDPTPSSRAVASRSVDDGLGHIQTWHYAYSVPSSTSINTTVTDPDHNDTVHVFTPVDAVGCMMYETSTRFYSGSSTGAGQLLKQVDTHYQSALVANESGAAGAMPGNIVPDSIKTTLYPGDKVMQVTKSYDQPFSATGVISGNVITEKAYDWGPSAPSTTPLRETDTTYKWQLDPAYLAAHLLDLPASVVVKDPAGSRVAQTDYSYDEFALQPNSGGIPAGTFGAPPASVRGNQTTVSQWLSTSNSFVSSTTHWYDTGEPYQKFDPLGHSTTFTYDPAYAGAYVTRTCNALSQCVSGTYDFNTGLLSSFSNANATTPASGLTPGDANHTWLYTYDLMFRIASAQAPADAANGGQRATTSFTYATGTMPWSVTRTRPVTGALTDSVTTSFDGLGRPFQTQHAMPIGPPSTVITTYDELGRVASVTNPFFTTSDPTYGVTQTFYDPLDRPLLVQKPDNSYSTVAYHDNCTTTQDEAGNARRSCTDALGRLYQVDEPGGASAPAATDTSNTDTSAVATVTIGGFEQLIIPPPPRCPPPPEICDPTPSDPIYDWGTVSVTVNGHTTSASYGQGDTASSVALRLANALTADPSAVVSGSVSGSLVTLTARIAGRAGDAYTYSATQSYDTGDFSHPSFTATALGPRLLGGANDSVFNHAWVTQYHYDVLGNLLCVEQHGDVAVGVNGAAPCPAPSTDANSLPVPPDPANPWRLRQFAYDSLSRLRWASNPESGVITYQYDSDGNLLQKTSPQANQQGAETTTISYCYDQLNRLLAKGYANSPSSPQQCLTAAPWLPAPAATFTYDAGTEGKGHLTSLTDEAGSGSYSFDVLGRMTSEQRTISGVSKSMGYSYQLGGSLKSLTYPSNRVVTYAPDSAGRLVSATDGNGTTYVSGADYNAPGSLTSLVNGGTLTSSFLYNPRLQLCRITDWTSGSVPSSCVDPAAHGNLMDRGYNFNLGSADNGNVMSITNYRDSSRNQTFTYDALNRITAGWSTAGTGALSWGENYSVDPWGNLMTSPMSGKAHGGNFQCAGDPLNHATCLGYDAAGNVTTNSPASYVYDQENRIASTAGMTYIYDANGNRVEKTGSGSGTLYWYGSPGILAETDLSGTLKSEYVFFNGKRVARIDSPGNSVHYYLSDHLNSTSMVVSAAGVTEEESDYSPFGTEYPVISSGVNHYKFTGKERDAESQLDYFGARYYSNGLGRFITPDWAAKAAAVPYAVLEDPQSLNLYGYVRNVPTSRVDLDGHSDYLWQKTKNLFSGKGWKTDAQVKGLSVAQTAQNHVGSKDWAINATNTSGKDVGHPQVFKPGSDKCNQFVGDTLAEAGKTRPEITDKSGNTRMPSAHELADPKVKIPGLSAPKPLSQAKPGDVIAQEHGNQYGHAGIVVMDSNGHLATISANATGNYGGQITQNDWGFRPAGQNGESATDPAPVVRTPQ